MKDNWKQIRKDIIDNVKEVFENSTLPKFSNVEQGVELFRNVLNHKTGIKKLDGLSDSILEALFEIYNTKPGKINPTENIMNNIEPFLKKIIFLNFGNDFTNDTKKNLFWCLKELKLITGNPWLDEKNLSSYKGSPFFLEHICKAYISRNQIHNAPKLKATEVYSIVESGLVVYIYATLKNESLLINKVGATITQQAHEDNYKKYALSVLSYNSSIKMLETDFGIKMQSFDDFEIKVKARAKKRTEERAEYLKDSPSNTLTPIKFLPEIDGVMTNPKYLLLHGIATSGKSTILKKLGKDFIEKFNSPFLFYLELGELFKKIKDNTIEQEIKIKYKELTNSNLDFEKINERILILLDGLDEVPGKEKREIIIQQILNFKKYNNIQVIITSRTNDFITNNNQLDNYFEKFELLPINVSDIIALGGKILGNGSQFNNFVKMVKQGNLLKAFPKTPLTSILLAILFKEKDINVKELPKNITELYRKFVDLFLNRWDKNKGISEQFEIQKKEFVLQTIAAHMQKNRFISIPESDLEKFINDLAKKKQIGGPIDPKNHLQNLCERTSILIKDELNNSYKFFHLTIQEYLAAQKFDYKEDDLLVKYFYDEWWLNPNIFYAGNKTEYPEILKRVSKFEFYPLDAENKFNFIAHSSQVLQAAHNIDNDIRNEVLKSMIKIFDEFSKELIKTIVSIPEFIDAKQGLDKKLARIKNQTLLDLILTLRDIFMEFFSITDFQGELNNIWTDLIRGKNKIEMSDTTLYSLSYCIALKSKNAMFLEDFVLTENIEINSRWFRIIEVDIKIKKLENTRKHIILKIKHIANKNKEYIQKQFNERIKRHYMSLTGIK